MTAALTEILRWVVVAVMFAVGCLIAAFIAACREIWKGKSCARKLTK